MRAFFSDTSRFGGQPWWIALPLLVLWGVLGLFFWICAGVWIVARFLTQQVQRGWRAARRHRAA
jgi:hypothetical protein